MGKTALHLSALSGHLEIVTFLAKTGAPIQPKHPISFIDGILPFLVFLSTLLF